MEKRLKEFSKIFIRIAMYLLRVFPIDEKKVVFSTFSARTYGDNPKYIAEKVVELEPLLDCVFVLNDPESVKLPKGIRAVKHNTVAYLYEMATAKVWVDNTRKQPHIIKRKGQVYIQTWHGGLSFKKVEKDAMESLDASYIKTAIHDSTQIDYLLTNSVWGENQLRKCFWYEGPIIMTGSPRLDILFEKNEGKRRTIRKNIGVDDGIKVLLYAPTFRRDQNIRNYSLNYSEIIRALSERFGGTWAIALRLHPNISDIDLEVPDNVINVTDYPDINELYLISEALITDYSSSIFDFSVLRRPAFIFATDYDDYRKDRDVYFEFDSLPFPFSCDNEQLESNIKLFDEDEYVSKLDDFFNQVGLVEDGNACFRVVEIIRKAVIGEKTI